MGLLKAKRRLTGSRGCVLKGPARNAADPKRPHEFEAGQPSQILGVPFSQLWVLRLLPDNRVLHDGIAEVIDHRRDCEYASQPFVQAFLRYRLLGLGARFIRARQYSHRCGG